MLNLTSNYITADGTRLHYYRTGGDKPAVVLVHGITDDGLCWMPVAEALADRYDVIMVDMRGHGLSEAPETGYSYGKMAAELAGLCQSLKLHKPVILGHSMGGTTTLILAGMYPDLPRAILLEDPPAFWRNDRPAAQFAESRNGLKTWVESNKRKTHADLQAELLTNNPGWQKVEWEPWINSKHRYSLAVTALIHPQDIEALDFPKLLKRITCPVIFISAEEKLGAASSKEDIGMLEESLPHMRHKPVAGAGHNIRRDQFERYMQIVEQALAEFFR